MSKLKVALLGVTAAVLLAVPAFLAVAEAPANTPAVTQPVPMQVRPPSFADLAEQLLPAVVNISSMQLIGRGDAEMDMPQFPPGSPFEDFFKDFMERNKGSQSNKPRRAASLGSGFVIDAKEGYIVTNNHVIADANEIKVILQDDTNLEARVVGRDEKTDLALLQVNPGTHKLTAVPWGDSDALRVGDWILAIGNPFGLGGTVTQGIISARARDIQSGPYDDYLQTDASINRGNSGGPMYNLQGQVVGINSAIFSPTGGSIGIGFAIPANLAKSVISQLIEYGRTKRGWLGVRIQAVTQDIADSLNFGQPRGALIAGMTPDGPAAVGGFKTGDIVVQFDGRPIEDMRRLPRVVAETPVGKDVKVTVWRQGTTVELTVKVAEMAPDEAEATKDGEEGTEEKAPTPAEAKAYGMSLSTLSKTYRAEHDIDESVQGVLVTDVEDDSAATELGIEPGDVIVEANQVEVKSPDELTKQIDTLKKSGRKSIFLLVSRASDLRFVALPLQETAKEE